MSRDDRLIYLLFRAQNRLLNHLEAELSGRGIRISTKQSGVLFLLREEDLQTMSSLAARLATDGSALTGMIDRLEKNGFVTRRADEKDRRQFRIALTPEGLKEVNRAEKVIRSVNEAIKEGFTEEQVDAFRDVLGHILKTFHNE